MHPSPTGSRPGAKGHLPEEEDRVFHTQMGSNDFAKSFVCLYNPDYTKQCALRLVSFAHVLLHAVRLLACPE
jgi:hypothetical protein